MKVESLLSRDGMNLQVGDFTTGILQTSDMIEEPHFLTGGYQLRVPEGQVGKISIVRVTEVNERRIGPSEAQGEVVYWDSFFGTSRRTETGIRYRTQNDRWIAVDRGEVEYDILSRPIEDSNETSNILLSGFDPRAALPIAIELLVRSEPGEDVAIYTPGTQSHWGNKKQVRREFSRYGISADTGTVWDAVPLDEIYSTAYISQGEIKPYNESPMPSKLILTKNPRELSDADTPEHVVANYVSQTPEEDLNLLEEFERENEAVNLVKVWSPLTKIRLTEVPKYGIPENLVGSWTIPLNKTVSEVKSKYSDREAGQSTSESILKHTIENTEDSTEEYPPPPPSVSDLLGYLNENRVTVKKIDASKIEGCIESTISIFDSLRGEGYDEEAKKVFNTRMFFERLPIPTDVYDRWIEERRIEGERYLPKSSGEYVEELKSYDSTGASSLLPAVRQFEEIHHRMMGGNPMFDTLIEMITSFVEEDETVAVFSYGKKLTDILKEVLVERSEIEDGWLGDVVEIVNPDSIRDISPHDRLVFTGPQRSSNACFYIHPRVEETIVLTYTDQSKGIVERQVKNRTEKLDKTLTPSEHGIGVSIVESEGSEENGGDYGGTRIPEDLDEIDLNRLKDIAELAPTKNGELMDRWGLDSGSDVYQYLSDELNHYYTRNESKYIVLTDEGEELIDKIEE